MCMSQQLINKLNGTSINALLLLLITRFETKTDSLYIIYLSTTVLKYIK